ncbi:MAG TPA: hypothetical protein VF800_06900 [Telluria sp.]
MINLQKEPQPTEKPLSGLVTLGMFSFGCYLLLGAYFSWVESTWPSFMPPQLDIFGLLFRLFGDEVGAKIGAIFLAILGIFFALGAAVAQFRITQVRERKRFQ